MQRLVFVIMLALLIGACASKKPASIRNGSASSGPSFEDLVQGPFEPNRNLYLCPNSKITNAAFAGDDNKVRNFSPIIIVEGKVVMAAVPVNDACITSGFGLRWGRTHKGIDLKSSPAGLIYSAAPGIVKEAGFNSGGFGNQVVIDHGHGVYTRYAHMRELAPGLSAGQRIGFGHPLGVMGRSGSASGVHLHFEVLTGDYDTPQKAWGLIARDPLAFPPYQQQYASR